MHSQSSIHFMTSYQQLKESGVHTFSLFNWLLTHTLFDVSEIQKIRVDNALFMF